MVWLYRSPLAAGRKGVLFVFICRLPAFAAPIRGEGGAVSTLSSRQGGEQEQQISFFELADEKERKRKDDLLASALSILLTLCLPQTRAVSTSVVYDIGLPACGQTSWSRWSCWTTSMFRDEYSTKPNKKYT